jgi:hypothetical protein
MADYKECMMPIENKASNLVNYDEGIDEGLPLTQEELEAIKDLFRDGRRAYGNSDESSFYLPLIATLKVTE